MVQTLSRRGRPRTARARSQKRRILEAASAVFRRRGLHAAGMREIAAELGMHVGNLYYYFDNKAELLAYCQEETLAELLDLAEEVAARDLPAAEKLRALVRGHVIRLNETIPGSLAHLEVEALEPSRREAIVRKRDAYERIWRRVLRQGMQDGSLAEVDPKVAAMALLGSVNWTVKWYQPGGRRSAAEIGDDFAQLLVSGLERRETP